MQAAAAAQIAALISGRIRLSFSSTYLPLITAAAGYGASLFTETRRDLRAAKRADVERQAADEAKQRDRRETFELDVLLRTQKALTDLARAATRHYLADMRLVRETGTPYGTGLVDDELSQLLMTTNRVLREVEELILDDSLRAHVEFAHEALNQPARPGVTADDAEALWVKSGSYVDGAQRAIGERIRQIYKGSVTTP